MLASMRRVCGGAMFLKSTKFLWPIEEMDHMKEDVVGVVQTVSPSCLCTPLRFINQRFQRKIGTLRGVAGTTLLTNANFHSTTCQALMPRTICEATLLTATRPTASSPDRSCQRIAPPMTCHCRRTAQALSWMIVIRAIWRIQTNTRSHVQRHHSSRLVPSRLVRHCKNRHP